MPKTIPIPFESKSKTSKKRPGIKFCCINSIIKPYEKLIKKPCIYDLALLNPIC